METTGTPEDGGTQSWGPGEPASDDDSYGTGYGYGPGHGPGDGDYGYGYGTPAPAPGDAATGGRGREAVFGGPAADRSQLPPVVGPTPALRGLPGGPGIEPAADEFTPASGTKQREASGSMWQQAQSVWSDAGVVWQRPATEWQSAGAEWERTQPSVTPPRRRRRKGRSGRGVPRPAGAGTSGAGPSGAGPVGPEPPRPEPGDAGPDVQDRDADPAVRRRSRRISGAAVVIGIAIVIGAVVVVAVAAYLIRGAGGGEQKVGVRHPHRSLPVSPYPPAVLAGADFRTSPSLATRGVFQSLTAVASYGTTVVAAGSQTGAQIGRTQFFYSTDAGRTWQLAPVTTPDGDEPPSMHVPAIIAAGPAGWVALGSGASWTSQTGQSWQLTATPGLPLEPGDRMLTAAATAYGFLVAGSATTHGITVPVVWTSPDGRSWERVAGPQLRLRAAGTVGAVTGAAAHGDNAVITAQVTTTVPAPAGKRRRVVHRTVTGAWQSTDGGLTWTRVTVPVSSGAVNAVSGLASARGGFVVVRPGTTSASGSEGVIYFSATGRTWGYAGRITAGTKARLRVLSVWGGDQGAVIAATVTGGNLLAYRSVNGASWHQTAVLANTRATSLSGLAVLPGGGVVAAGATAALVGRQAFLEVAAAARAVVDLARIQGASFPQWAVNAVASTPGLDVAVGSSNSQPAVWAAPPGAVWQRARGAAAAVFGRPGQVTLTGVTAGGNGWLAVGGPAGGPPHPVVVFSPDGRTWRAADGAAAFAQAGTVTSAAASRRSRYVIVGAQAIGTRTIAAAWWSSGLGTWNRAADAGTGALDGKDGTRRMAAVTPTASGFVAVGRHGGLPAAWTSTDGRAWRLINLPAASGGSGYLAHVAASGDTVVAAGTIVRPAGNSPLLAVSSNGGLTWREVTAPVPGNASRLTGVTATGSGFVAVGAAGAPGQRDVIVLTSGDGITWKLFVPSGTGLSGRGAQEITALTTAAGRLLGIGFTATARTEYPTLWIAPPAPVITASAAAHRPPGSS